MRKQSVCFIALVAIQWAFTIQAQTLDELNRLLLKKGQWNLALDYKNFGHEYWGIGLDHEEISSIDSQVILFPRLAFGLAKNLQLIIDGARQFPITNAMPQFETWDYWRETNTLCLLSAQLRFRPARNLELGFFWLTGQAKEDVHYARTVGVDDHITAVFSGDILILSGTWLSSVDSRSRLLRADLDGLHRPLLKKGRWRIDPEILIRRHEFRFQSRLDALPDFIDSNMGSTDLRLRLTASHGLTDQAQVKADIYWQPSFRISESSRSMSTWWDGTESYHESDTSRLYSKYWGGRGSVAWRPVSQWELKLACSRNQLEETESPRKYMHVISQVDVETVWISRAKRSGTEWTADLPGLYQPLLEKKQFQWDNRISYRAYRENNVQNEGWWDTDAWLIRTQVAYGLNRSFQVTAYYGVHFFKHWFSSFDYEKRHTLGMDLKWRLKKRSEIYWALNYYPMTYLDEYPPFMLGIHEQFWGGDYHDFLSIAFGEALNIMMGIRLVIGK